MNKIEQKQEELDKKQKADQISFTRARRGFMVAAVVAAVGLVLYEADNKKGSKIEVFDLNKRYSNYKAHFDTLLVYATQNYTAPWIDRGGGRKELNIPIGKGEEKYILSIFGDQMTLSLSSHDHEYIWKYTSSGLLEVKEDSRNNALFHFGEVQKLIRQQYPNF